MRHICIVVMVFFALALPLSAQEEEPDVDAYNPCNGTWILLYDVNWSVKRIEDGLTKIVPVNATILGCGGQPEELREYMINVKAVVRCTNSSEPEGEPYVEKVRIICE